VRLSPYAFLDDPTEAPLLIDAAEEQIWTQQDTAAAVEALAGRLAADRAGLVFNLCERDVDSVIRYLAAIRAGHAVAQLPASTPPELTERLVEHYRPAFVLAPGEEPRAPVDFDDSPRVHPDLAVLLSTSGTTGNPKLVRLSRQNIEANTASIVSYLEIDERERGLQSLPIHYSYGLSVLNTHLAAGASLILSAHSIIRPDFWADAARWGGTSFAGVPYSYELLERTGLLGKAFPDTLRTLTVSGSPLGRERAVRMHELITERGGRLFLMYGQTESTARISYVPPSSLPEKAHTIGVAIPGCKMYLVDGELVFEGENVMLGYAEAPDELELGDVVGGVLHTGDLAEVDEDGFFRITGRIKRIAKLYGLRVNLDDVEAAASEHGVVAAIDGGDEILIWREPTSELSSEEVGRALAEHFGLNSRAFTVTDVEALPLNPRGKVDYGALARLRAG